MWDHGSAITLTTGPDGDDHAPRQRAVYRHLIDGYLRPYVSPTCHQLVGNVQTYSGNATVGSSSDLVIIMVQAWDANALEDPANWTVTLGGGSALTAR